MANKVNNGNDYSGKYFRLTEDISVTTMVGNSESNSFRGTFDGDGHTLTFTKGSSESAFNEESCAPFRHVKNATITNLQVAGTIYTSAMRASGLVATSHGALTLAGCRSSVNINSSRSGDGTHGGLVAITTGSSNNVTIDGCVFDGSFATTSSTYSCGGFVGWTGENTPAITNSLMKPGCVAAGMLNNTFARWQIGYEPTITNCYYITTDNLPTDQGKLARSISAGDNVTISNLGASSAAYNVSGITVYAHGIKYGSTFYASNGDEVSLTLSHGDKAGYTFNQYTVTGGGTLANPTTNTPTLTMTDADQTICAAWLKILTSDNITIESVIYNGGSQTATVKCDNVTLTKGNDYTVDGTDALTDVGSTTFTITGTGSYTGTVEKTFTITSKALTITANAQTITYGGSITNGIGQVTTEGLVDGDALNSILLTKNYTDYSAEAYADGITPSAAVVLRDENTVTSNYDITYVSGALTINKASITPSVSMAGWTYGDDAKNPVVTNNIGEGTVSYTYMAEGASEYTSDKPTNAGTHTVKATIAATANYNGAEITTTYTVSKATLTATVQDVERSVGSDNPTFTVNYTGFVNSEDETVVTTAPTFACTADEDSPVGNNYSITASGAVAANYVFTYVPGTLKVYRNFAFADSDWKTWYGTEDLSVNTDEMETYVVTEVTSSTIVVESTNGKIYLNKPMLIKRKESNMTDVRGYAPTSPISLSLELSPAYIGGVSSFADYTAGTVYTLAGTEFIRTRVTASTTFDPSKCFIFLASGGASSRLSISGDGTTGITPMVSDGTRDDWYTISGRKLSKRPKQPGVYIWNGKKVVIK